ncbi:MAG: hypothetical protein ABL971_05730 [Vicinamibacterales bacterium]
MRTFLALSVPLIAAAAFGTPALTQTRSGGTGASQQEQKVLPPEARYWMGVTTMGGITAMGGGMAQGRRPSMSDMMRMSSLPSEAHSVELRLGSTLPPKGGPEASHTMPPGAQVNKPIFLQTPEPGRTQGGSPEPYRQPKGQISFYWGCGEKAGAGQPVVLTFDKLVRGENDPELQSLQGAVSARQVSRPTAATSKTYGDWPPGSSEKNKNLQAAFQTGSTLAGPHVVEGTYTPKIEFTLPDGKSYMDAVRYTSTTVQPSGAMALGWATVGRATGYAIGVMAPEKMNDDSANIVMWSSADRPATFIQNEDLTPAEVNRLIGLKAVLPPSTTSCAVPAEVMKATKDGSMLMFTAFGDEATFVHPARPADPAVTWDQEWFSRVSFKSARMDMVSQKGVMDLGAMSRGGGAPDAPSSAAGASPAAAQSDEEYCRALEAERAKKGSPIGGRLGGRLGRVLGGRNKQDEEPVDPRCVKK